MWRTPNKTMNSQNKPWGRVLAVCQEGWAEQDNEEIG